jgi:hypothetical protein
MRKIIVGKCRLFTPLSQQSSLDPRNMENDERRMGLSHYQP